ncbi:Uma2 family endonuclease [Paracidobacterium acidisoli]|uniref:Uma2 family endonuclease n=1 Tax=Paracidobacterium acidisoli TaxID=2303751 RepID=A0A372ITD4_9BACT|nr:Uma2 family endonuclease [Paracidobacterium acidisoli]MBT9329444.1 Uma2 family endonuclease [Paracidobacterium acidisoli]
MGTTLISLDYYLHETWSPDREFVDGEVVEWSWAERNYVTWQVAFMVWLSKWRQSANIRVFPALRMRTRSARFRIPDVMATDRDAPEEQIITHAPLLCVEILSPEDRIGRMEDKIEEYFQMGVRAVWVIDPRTQTGYQCEGPHFQEWKAAAILTIPGTPVQIEMSALIADLD